MTLCVYLAVTCFILHVSNVHFVYGVSCNVSEFRVQDNFDVKKYTGQWYEMKFLLERFVAVSDRYIDYSHTYGTPRNGTIPIKTAWRAPGKPCFEKTSDTLHLGSSPGKLKSNRPFGPEIYTDYWIIATDYDNYALVYGCVEMAADDTCKPKRARTWVWSRKRSLSADKMALVDQKIGSLCLNGSDYYLTSQNSPCPELQTTTVSGAISGEKGVFLHYIWITFFVLLMHR